VGRICSNTEQHVTEVFVAELNEETTHLLIPTQQRNKTIVLAIQKRFREHKAFFPDEGWDIQGHKASSLYLLQR
jgi:hypothetical protein